MSDSPRPSRLRRLGHHGLRLVGWLQTGTVVLAGLVLGLTLWLLATESGLRNALALAQQFSGGALQVESAEGRLLTPLHLRGLRLNTAAAEVAIEAFSLSADWSQLPHRIAVIKRLEVHGVNLRLAPPRAGAPPPDERGGPPDLRLPFGLIVGTAHLDGLQVDDAEGNTVFALQDAELVGRWVRSDIRLQSLRLQHEDYGAVEAALQAHALAEGLRIDELRLSGPGTITAQGRIGLSAQAPNDLALSWQGLHWPPQGDRLITSPDGQLSASGTWTALEFDADFGLGPEARFTADGRWSPAAIDARLAWTDLADPRDPAASIWRSRRGQLTVQGVPEDYGFELDGELVARDIPGRLRAQGRGDLGQVRLETFVIEALEGSLSADGRIAWRPAVAGELALKMRNLDPSALVLGWAGRISGQAEARFELDGGAPDASFEIAIGDSRLRERDFSLDARGRYAGGALQLETVDLASGRTRLTAHGQATPPFDLQASVDSPNLEALWPGLGGSAQFDVQLRGRLPVPQADVRGRLADLAYLQYRLAAADIEAAIDPQQPMRVRIEAQGVDAGQPIDRARLSIDGPLGAHRLQLAVETPHGDAGITLDGALEPTRPRWDGQVAALSLTPRGAEPWTLEAPAPLGLAADEARIGDACLGGSGGRACLRAHYDPARTEASVDLERFALEYLRPLLPEDYGARGDLSGTASVTLPDSGLPVGDVALRTGELWLRYGGSILELAPSTIELHETAEGLAARIELNLSEGQLRLDAHAAPGEVPADRELGGELLVSMPDLGVLQRASPEVGEATGSLQGRFALGGTLGLPSVNGGLAVEDGSIRLETPGILLTQLRANVSGSSAGQVELRASAESGKGTLDLSGKVDFAAKPRLAELHIGGDRFQAANTPAAKVWIDPDLDIRLGPEGLDVSGAVGVPQALITPERFKGSGAVSPSGDQIILDEDGEVPEPAMPIRAQVSLKLGDKVRFEGYGLKSRFAGSMTVIERPGRLTSARGQIGMVEGQYEAYGQSLKIETGRLIYSGGPIVDPTLELRASRQPRDNITVGVIVRGTLDQPQFNLYSNPSMTQQEQLSWLVLGRPLSSGGGDDAALANAALSLGLKGGQWFAQKIGGGIGLDEVSIGAEAGQTAEQAQLTIGKYLSPKLYVSYGVSLFQPGSTFKMRYDLGKGFAVETESGVHSGGDLLYSIEK